MENIVVIPAEKIERAILHIRGHRVMLDADLAEIYGVSTKRLNEQVRRNLTRFPPDIMFQLTEEENPRWSQFATTSRGAGFRLDACSKGGFGSPSASLRAGAQPPGIFR